jgi:hypothetical protein
MPAIAERARELPVVFVLGANGCLEVAQGWKWAEEQMRQLKLGVEAVDGAASQRADSSNNGNDRSYDGITRCLEQL